MSLNEIQLPLSLIIDLYKNVLIEIPPFNHKTFAVSKNDTIPPAYNRQQDSQKNILIIVSYPGEASLPKQQHEFLYTILKACELNTENITVVNATNLKEDLQTLIKRIAPKIILVFGVDTLKFHSTVRMAIFEHTEIESILTACAPELEKLYQNDSEGKILKKRLWSMLKKIFDVV